MNLTVNREIMGECVNPKRLTVIARVIAGLVIALNLALILLLAFGIE
ncbi:hypothetical protein [Boudabousia marimammalium]